MQEVKASVTELSARPRLATPPPASLQEGVFESPGVDSTGSEADSGSPTLTFRTPTSDNRDWTFSSPSLPSLPTDTVGTRAASSRSSPSFHPGTESSLYYTASWGSPYHYQSPEAGSTDTRPLRQHHHYRIISSDSLLGESPSSRLFALSSDAAAPNLSGRQGDISSGRSSDLLPSPILTTLPQQPIRGLTEERMSQYLSGHSNSERGNWWSDDSAEGTSNSDNGKLLPASAQEKIDAWSEIDEDFGGGRRRTPDLLTQSNWKVATAGNSKANPKQGPRRHKSKKSNETLKQTDFWRLSQQGSGFDPRIESMQASIYADPPSPLADVAHAEVTPPAPTPDASGSVANRSSPSIDKALPPPPPPPPPSQEPEPSQQESNLSTVPSRPTHRRAPTMSSSRKRVLWRGKNCVISLPVDDQRGKPGAAPVVLTPPQVKERLKSWEDLGLDTRGFGYWNQRAVVNGSEGQGQSRSVYPDPDEVKSEGQARKPVVSIPDRREWEAYVKRLNEERLRALGVSIGDEEIATSASPAPSAMSRQISSQYTGPPFSPPVAPSSAASNQAAQHASPFSPPFMGGTSTNPSSRVASIASPISANASVTHYHISGSYGGRERNFSPSFQLAAQQANLPAGGLFSSQKTEAQLAARSGSPVVYGSLANVGAMMSPSPASMSNSIEPKLPNDYFYGVPGNPEEQQHQERRQPEPQPQLPDPHKPSGREEQSESCPTPTNARDASGDVRKYSTDPQDASQTLANEQSDSRPPVDQRVGDADYHLEDSISRQLVEEDDDLGTNPTSPFDTEDMRLDHTSFSEILGASGTPPNCAGTGVVATGKSEEAPQETETQVTASINNEEYPQASVRSSTLHHPQPHARTHSLSQRRLESNIDPFRNNARFDSDLSENAGFDLIPENVKERGKAVSADLDVETNPSTRVSPEFNLYANDAAAHSPHSSTASNPWSGHVVHSPSNTQPPPVKDQMFKSSQSKLNVGAKEFQFDLSNSFTPGDFSFTSSSFQPAFPGFSHLNDSPQSGQHNRMSNAFPRAQAGRLSISAAAFEPSKTATSAFPTGDFNFSTSGPQFRPNAPSFTPSFTTGNVNESQRRDISTSDASIADKDLNKDKDRIFNVPGFIKPAKKSRAIPIIRPEDNAKNQSGNEDDAQEDESGRITQGDGRLKRVRRFDGDAPSPKGPTSIDRSVAEPELDMISSQVPKSVLDPSSISDEARKVGKTKRSPNSDANNWLPYEFAGQDEARDFNDARPLSPPKQTVPNSITSQKTGVSDQEMDELSVQQAELATEITEPRSFTGSQEGYDVPQPTISDKADLSLSRFDPNEFDFDFSLVSSQPLPLTDNLKAKNDTISPQAHSPNPGLGDDPAVHFEGTITDLSAQDPFVEGPRDAEISDRYQNGAGIVAGSSRRESGGTNDFPNEGPSESEIRTNRPPWSPDYGKLQNADHDEPSPAVKLRPDFKIRSDAPSPSPLRAQRSYKPLPYEIPHPDLVSPNHGTSDADKVHFPYDSPVHRLNSPGIRAASDWDDVLSPSDENKFLTRSRFFDHHVDNLVGGLLQERLGPLEQAMKTIESSVALIAANGAALYKPSRTLTAGVAHSDADDEDDESEITAQHQPKSPRKDLRMERMREMILDAVASQQSDQALVTNNGWEEIHRTLSEMRSSSAQAGSSQQQNKELRSMFEEMLNEKLSGLQKPMHFEHDVEVEELRSRLVSLEQMLSRAQSENEKEIGNRRVAEEHLFEAQNQIRLLREDDARQRGLVEANKQRVQAFDNDMQQDLIQAQMQTAFLERERENLQKVLSDLSAKNAELESNLLESGMNDNRRRDEMNRMSHETRELRNTMDSMKAQMEESVRVREGLRDKFSKLQEDMLAASDQAMKEKETWSKRDQEHTNKEEMMRARLEAEARTRERLERELERLEVQEREAMKMRIEVEQTQNANTKLENVLDGLRLESIKSQQKAARFEQEFREAREVGRAEVQRTRVLFETDLEAANHQVNVVRADLEGELGRVRSDFEHYKLQANTSKAQSELLLEEAYDSKLKALGEASESKEHALKEQQRLHERQSDDLKFQHDRALYIAQEDKQRSETHMLERLSLSDSKVEHLQDKVTHLEERLEIAKTAAHAAAQAAKSAKVSPPPLAAEAPGRGSETPDKVSPQALRESILVLQEQLQEREGRIEKLDQELSRVDRAAPGKIKAQETEIAWLRELLGVRVGELEDIIGTLSQPSYDQEAVKEAAIRLKANLDMEQQEKERATVGGQSLPSLASISSFASPRAVLPLAAAWGNWRKGRDQAHGSFPDLAADHNQTPSKSSPSAQSFLSGLLTPPNTNLRQTPLGGESSQPHKRSTSKMNRSWQEPSSIQTRRGEKQPAPNPPATPPLLRQASYDQDAESGKFSTSGFYDEDDSLPDESVVHKGREEPFGPGITP
ncbi:MAG: hypothetical protein M1837_004931 [Sclerophora amabilis]|nr:MAG: hypothetical protein M1837_004931 [Sclerophora amabilis]